MASKINYTETARGILDNLGGKENISSVAHCMTRLRVIIKDKSKEDEEKIKKGDKMENKQEMICSQEDLVKFIKTKIKMSGMENQQIIPLLKMSKSTYYYKIKTGQFTMWEFLKLAKVLNINANDLRDITQL